MVRTCFYMIKNMKKRLFPLFALGLLTLAIGCTKHSFPLNGTQWSCRYKNSTMKDSATSVLTFSSSLAYFVNDGYESTIPYELTDLTVRFYKTEDGVTNIGTLNEELTVLRLKDQTVEYIYKRAK